MNTLRNAVIGAVLAATGVGTLVAAEATADASKETSIPFVNLRQSIYSWQDDGQMGMWIQDIRKQWYYAKFNGPCQGVEFAVRLGFETKTLNTLDRFGTVIVPDRGRCPLVSLVKSDPPPNDKKSRKVDAEAK